MSRLKKWLLGLCFLLLAVALWVVFSPTPQGIPVLEYHEVAESVDEDAYVYNVPPEEFRQQLDYLQQQGYTTISMLDFMKAKRGKMELPAKPIILTFDELRDMQDRGIEIGSHTANHDPLTGMDAARQLDEVHLSKLLLEWNGIHTVYTFSYPNGAYDASLPALLAQNEYLTAVTGDAGLNTFETDPYLMQRVNIPHPRFGLLEFKLRLLKAEVFTKLRIHQHLEDPS